MLHNAQDLGPRCLHDEQEHTSMALRHKRSYSCFLMRVRRKQTEQSCKSHRNF